MEAVSEIIRIAAVSLGCEDAIVSEYLTGLLEGGWCEVEVAGWREWIVELAFEKARHGLLRRARILSNNSMYLYLWVSF